MMAAAKDPRLKKRTLTNFYNECPTWLKVARLELDKAVLAAYAPPTPRANGPKSGPMSGSTPAPANPSLQIIP